MPAEVPDTNRGYLRHVVLFGFKSATSAEEICRIEQAFAALPDQIEEIHAFEWGTNVSVENAARGYTHCFLVTFRDEAGRDAYLPHPAHKAFGDILHPHLEQSLVIDYWTSES